MPNWIEGTLKLRGRSGDLKAFFDDAILWAFRELDDAFSSIEKLGYWVRNHEWESAKEGIINAMLHIAERWTNETDVELECVDPKTGEVTVIGGNEV
jgi:hypothetical protein